MSCDPFFNNVSFLAHFDSTPGGVFVDDSNSNWPITTIGSSPTLDLGNFKFGPGSIDFGDFGGPIGGINFGSATPGNSLDLDSGDFTIEFWIYARNAGGSGVIFSSAGGSFQPLAVGYNGGTGSASFTFFGVSAPAVILPFLTWTSIAVVMHSDAFVVYINGIATAAPIPVTRTGYAAQVLQMGTAGASPDLHANIDEMRITKGVARYLSNYTPATAPFGVACGPAPVPSVVGEVLATAEADIIAGGFIVGVVTTGGSFTIPAGSVISQNPAGGTIAIQGTPVDLVESIGNVVAAPDLTNISVAVVAPAILAAVGLTLGTITYEASGVIIAGNIIRQSPVAGTIVSVPSTVNVVVSSGLPALRVPDIFGLSQADAILAITSLGLVVGAISSAPSQFVPPGTVQAQNPSAGIPVAVGSVVSFVLSLGTPAVGTMFDFEATVISQYANSPTILQLVQNLNQYIDQSANFANFFNFVWNVDTAVGFGLNIWGKIVGVSRLLQIPNTTNYVGFDNGTRSPPDWQSMGSDQPPQPAVGGAMYTGFNATSTYILGDDAYRQLILAKAFANIAATTAPAINTILQNLYGKGTAWVLNTGPMAISYNLSFKPSAIQLAILEQSGIIPTPPGVSVTIVVPP